MIKLYQLVNVPPTLKEGRDMIDSLEIRLLRHKLCSHSTNYHDKNSDSIQTHVPIRVLLRGFKCGYMNNKEIKYHSIDLQKAIDEHLETMIEMLDRILNKAIKTLYKGQKTSEGYIEFSEKLEDLRIIRRGGLVNRLPDGSKLIFTMAPIQQNNPPDARSSRR